MVTEELFTVWTFFEDGTHEPDGPAIPLGQAVKRAKGITESVGARVLGVVTEIRIVDRGDDTVFQWTKADGVIFPTRNA